ncbi:MULTISPECIES: 1-deoxy-D-xylulose-5-phosphate reductoisomerase [unclassified Microbacterium]|uniref:1-deoxy-D-xylulose-5-phosphate reductoisomerase n=1 Tax=unclassified Microbacterium TaxID=2609290 RepID=UPI00049340DC|nr:MULTISPECIES: 1-deoxy-D-xylulose-5-phosphate reductoisomerase [unclassified Microbacterium]MCV0333337.1 1-deoxy-D-xylulose-5-phosphate reductoisomerase [Microbacterium sp.]MCV0375782.1 1-deoxy-D-xylulose-5-phosphate reductoisomerase [Microbacterium sp.]MCV0388863.1 1-deoxy-D-xylulose-5-phosphate reductoisomerase [Microbacterium sp.]MCV0417391.1 1-deoxy-D-xylulose-5-phosphate reductoisomerase [Microbacterium sp.]MCV0420702.1 1-deoxy-D-xylulose-5-phosphate reductoisomerase [Microbacterium sp.
MRRVIVLGSTGSIGTQALDVIRANPRRFELVGLAAGSNAEMLEAQAAQFQVESTALGALEAEQLVRDVEADVVLNAITGSIGLGSTLAALKAGRTLALANKESLIVGGDLVLAAAAPGQIVPVDSEHSALAQALLAGTHAEVRRLVVTASGGPFRGRSRAELTEVTPSEALAHPTWDMGRMVTTNSATLVNKGLEVIEAHLLFDIAYDDIEVVVHPQSIVHSMVEFIDGSTIAQASPPDMRLPISLGLDWPHRVGGVGRPLDWSSATSWTFEPLDAEAFPSVALAKAVGRAGGTFPAVYNAANEQAVDAFHEGRLSFLGIVDTIARVVDAHDAPDALTVETLAEAEAWARSTADRMIAAL